MRNTYYGEVFRSHDIFLLPGGIDIYGGLDNDSSRFFLRLAAHAALGRNTPTYQEFPDVKTKFAFGLQRMQTRPVRTYHLPE